MNAIRNTVNRIFGINTGNSYPDIIRMNEKPTRLFDAIVFPYIDLSDPIKSTLFNKAVGEMRESFTGKYARINICPVSDLMELAELTLYGEAAAAYNWLHKLHCVYFSEMNSEIARQVPYRINMVFAGGDYTYPWERAVNAGVKDCEPQTVEGLK